MSYCRFSSDNFSCDVYVYEHVYGGWMTHVAGMRIIGDVPPLPDITSVPVEEFLKAYKKQSEFMGTADRAPINGPFDGQTFTDDSPQDCANRLLEIRAAGYTVPQYAIDALIEEHKELEKEGKV